MMLTSQSRSQAFQVSKSPNERKELKTIRSLSLIIDGLEPPRVVEALGREVVVAAAPG